MVVTSWGLLLTSVGKNPCLLLEKKRRMTKVCCESVWNCCSITPKCAQLLGRLFVWLSCCRMFLRCLKLQTYDCPLLLLASLGSEWLYQLPRMHLELGWGRRVAAMAFQWLEVKEAKIPALSETVVFNEE